MPYYTIHHISPLTMTQKDFLAAAITDLHSQRFSAMRNFVNVRFEALDPSADLYIGGTRRVSNHITATVRSGPTRSRESWDALCADIHSAWNRIVIENAAPRAKGSTVGGEGGEGMELRAISVQGGIVTGMEAGVAMPPAGQDGEWLERNWTDFVRRAEAGEREWVENVAEARKRGMAPKWDGDGKTATQRLEEALGWGDSA